MSTDTDTDTDLAECDSCGEDVLPLFELRGDDAVGADVLCSECLADDDTTEAGERDPDADTGEVTDE